MPRHLFPLTALLLAVFIPSASIGQIQPGGLDPGRLRQFERTIEDLRQRLRTR
jgi:hypothetical protein